MNLQLCAMGVDPFGRGSLENEFLEKRDKSGYQLCLSRVRPDIEMGF